METPPEIVFVGMKPGARIRESVASEVDNLETFFGRITSCHVSVRAPSGRHRQGGRYEVSVHLGLPDGRQVSARNASTRETHKDALIAIRDVFNAARRQLQDKARKLRGDIKHHEPPPMATVSALLPEADHGFLSTADGREVYFHRHCVVNGGFERLQVGDQITFVETMGEKGPQASTVKRRGKQART